MVDFCGACSGKGLAVDSRPGTVRFTYAGVTEKLCIRCFERAARNLAERGEECVDGSLSFEEVWERTDLDRETVLEREEELAEVLV